MAKNAANHQRLKILIIFVDCSNECCVITHAQRTQFPNEALKINSVIGTIKSIAKAAHNTEDTTLAWCLELTPHHPDIDYITKNAEAFKAWQQAHVKSQGRIQKSLPLCDNDIMFAKHVGSATTNSRFTEFVREQGFDIVALAGFLMDVCVEHTLYNLQTMHEEGAISQKPILIHDASTTLVCPPPSHMSGIKPHERKPHDFQAEDNACVAELRSQGIEIWPSSTLLSLLKKQSLAKPCT